MRRMKPWSRRVEANILRVLNSATPDEREQGLHWYKTAHNDAQAIAERHDIALYQAAGIIAVLSPSMPWGRNLLDADRLITAWRAGAAIPPVGAYGQRNIDKALAILEGANPVDVIHGPKTSSFFLNILQYETTPAVTIDRHAKALAFNIRENRDKLSLVKPKEYDWLAWHYQVIAGRFQLLPHQLQAITWVVWKRIVDNNFED